MGRQRDKSQNGVRLMVDGSGLGVKVNSSVSVCLQKIDSNGVLTDPP